MVGTSAYSSVFLLPLLASANSYTHISSGNVTLFYLPLALMISLMLFFGWGALPASYYRYFCVNIMMLAYMKH